MKRIFHLALLLAALTLASCTTLRKTAATSGVETHVCQYPTVADLNVLPKVERTVTWGFVPFNLGQPSLEVRKGNLLAETIKEAGADILLEPQFVYSKRSYGQRTLTVTGYPAQFKDFRKATKDDLEALKVFVPAKERKVYSVSQSWVDKIRHSPKKR